ncbi:hypothetical protein [Aquabacterium humicola]|uniref:hypothetical protein n=1 Tax=Aquabacterium humicola TaxID=3237377 RepID=UPI00254272B8|nr:hypothetical protein [Rubrivivax pictus]
MPLLKPFVAYATLIFASASGAAYGGTSADLFLRMQTEPPAKLIQYCKDAAPETQEALAAEYEVFKVKFAEAAAPLVTKLPADVPQEVAANVDRMIVELGERQLQAVKQLEPHGYCSWLLKSLRSTTTERLASTMQSAIDRYTEMARAKAALPAQR